MDLFIFTTLCLEIGKLFKDLKILKVLFAFLFLFFTCSQTFAHCAMCKATIEQSTNSNSIAYLALAALSLFIPALVLFLVMLVIIYKFR